MILSHTIYDTHKMGYCFKMYSTEVNVDVAGTISNYLYGYTKIICLVYFQVNNMCLEI